MLDGVQAAVLYGIISVGSLGLGYGFFLEMFPERRWKSGRSLVLAGIAACLAVGIQVWFGQYSYISGLGMILFPILHGTVLGIFCKCSYQSAFVWMWFYHVTFEAMKMPLQTAEKIFVQQGIRNISWEEITVIRIIWCFCIILLFSYIHKIWSRKLVAGFRDLLNRKREILFGFTILEWSMLAVLLYGEQWAVSSGNLILDVIVFVTLGFLFWQMYGYICRVKQIEQELVRQQTVWLREQKAIKDGYVKDAKRLHDMKHVLLYLQKCIAEKEIENAEEYLRTYTEEIAESQRKIWTGYSEIDFSVNYYYQMMREKGIPFAIETDVHDVPIEELDMMIILGNLLDNAITAAEKCTEGARKIHLKLQTVNEMFFLQVENSASQMPEKKNGRFLSSKTEREYHGWGIEHVRQIVEKYDGDIAFEYTESEFRAEIMIYGIRSKT